MKKITISSVVLTVHFSSYGQTVGAGVADIDGNNYSTVIISLIYFFDFSFFIVDIIHLNLYHIKSTIMKKAHFFFIVPIILLGSMRVSAQAETINTNSKTQISIVTSLEKARENYAIALENVNKAASSSRAEYAKFQTELTESKKILREELETAISRTADNDKKTILEEELAALNSTN
jgi:hypothetical protein